MIVFILMVAVLPSLGLNSVKHNAYFQMGFSSNSTVLVFNSIPFTVTDSLNIPPPMIHTKSPRLIYSESMLCDLARMERPEIMLTVLSLEQWSCVEVESSPFGLLQT